MDAVREAASGYVDAWGRGDGRTRLALVLGGALGAFLVGAFVFGAWHVVMGGLVRGNPRAAAFGVGLAAVSGVLLVVLRYVGRRMALRQPPSA